MEEEHIQLTSIIATDNSFHVPRDKYIKLERFTLIDDNQEYEGQRINIFVHGNSSKKDGQMIETNVPISSFIIGRDYEQEADLLISPADDLEIIVTGPCLRVQLLYSEYKY